MKAHSRPNLTSVAPWLCSESPSRAPSSRSSRRLCWPDVVAVELTPHLFTFFPELKGKAITVRAHTAREVVEALEELAPGLSFYLCDELGALRTHVNLFIGDERLCDRRRLSDPIVDGSRVLIMQALSGG